MRWLTFLSDARSLSPDTFILQYLSVLNRTAKSYMRAASRMLAMSTKSGTPVRS